MKENSFMTEENRVLSNENAFSNARPRAEHAMLRGLMAEHCEPVKMVKGSMCYFDNGGEEVAMFMPFTERKSPNVLYVSEWGRRGPKAKVRQTKYRTILTLDVPTCRGYEEMDALYADSDTRAALEAAFENETEVKQN